MLREFIYTDDWLDQLFQNKNKMYGAYQLRKRDADNTFIAFLWSLAIYATIGITTYTGYKIYVTFFSPIIENTISKDLGGYTIQLDKKTDTKFIEPTKPPVINTRHNNPDIIPTITDSVDNNNQVGKEPGDTGNGNPNGGEAGTDSTDSSGGGTGPGGGGIVDPPPAKPIRFAHVMPKFPGGDEALLEWLIREIKYPDILRERNKEGIVYVEFVVDEEGFVKDVQILKGVRDAEEFSEEAKRAVGKMPQWIPGEQNGHNVSVYCTIPINFRLK